jgi:hypothetical protein
MLACFPRSHDPSPSSAAVESGIAALFQRYQLGGYNRSRDSRLRMVHLIGKLPFYQSHPQSSALLTASQPSFQCRQISMTSTTPSIPPPSASAALQEKTAATPRTEGKGVLPGGVAAVLPNGGGNGKENCQASALEPELQQTPAIVDNGIPVGAGPIDAPTAPGYSQAVDKSPPGPSVIVPNPLIENLDPEAIEAGVLIPLKTVLEVRADHTVLQAYVTRAPTKCASDVMEYVYEGPGH